MSRFIVIVLIACSAACGTNAGGAERGPLLAYLAPDGALQVVDPATREHLRFAGDVALTEPFAWAPNGQLLVASDGVDLWTARPGGTPEQLTALDDGESAVASAWTTDGLRVAYQIEGDLPRIEVVDRLSGQVVTAYPRAANLGGWWEPAGLARPMLVVRDLFDEALYLVDVVSQTRRRIAEADAVLSSSGGAVWLSIAGNTFIWSAFEGVTPTSEVPGGADRATGFASLTAVETDGVISIVDSATDEVRTIGAGRDPAWQPTDAHVQPQPPARERRNLLTATTSFERGIEDWLLTGFNAPGAAVTSDDARFGDSAAEVTFGGEQSVFAAELGDVRGLVDGREVTFSAWVRTSEPGVHLRHVASNAEPVHGVASGPHPGDGEWHRLALTFTPRFDVGGDTSYAIVGIRGSGTGVALVDGVQLEYGAVATDYEPAPDDPLSALPRGEPIPPR